MTSHPASHPTGQTSEAAGGFTGRVTGDVTVHAHLRQAGTGALNEPELQHRHVQVDAPDYATGKQLILDRLPDGWIVASWRVE